MKIGNTVFLNSGSCPLHVTRVYEGNVTVVWESDRGREEHQYPISCLTLLNDVWGRKMPQGLPEHREELCPSKA